MQITLVYNFCLLCREFRNTQKELTKEGAGSDNGYIVPDRINTKTSSKENYENLGKIYENVKETHTYEAMNPYKKPWPVYALCKIMS